MSKRYPEFEKNGNLYVMSSRELRCLRLTGMTLEELRRHALKMMYCAPEEYNEWENKAKAYLEKQKEQ